MAVIDTASLVSRDAWIRESEVDDIALSRDGARLYAISDTLRRILVVDTTSGASLGEITPQFQPQAIIRIDGR